MPDPTAIPATGDDLERRADGRTVELRELLEGTTAPIFSVDAEYRYLAFNQSHVAAMRALYGAEIRVGGSVLDYMTEAEDRETARRNLDRALHGEHVVQAAYSGGDPATRRCFEVSHFPIRGSDGRTIGVAVFSGDVTDRERAEAERRAKIRFFETMDRVNRAMQGTNDLERMMSDVLEAVLASFDCDRAWLIHPCDPDTPSYRVPMERTRSGFPGALARGLEVPVDPDTVRVLLAARSSNAPVAFGPGTEPPLPAFLRERFGVQSQIVTTIYPKGAEPYMFGVHQCSHARVWTAEEKRLLQAIGWRLADGLTSLLSYRSLQQSEERYRRIVDTAAEGIWALGADATTTFVNARMAEMLGYPGAEMVGRPLTDFMFEADEADHLARMEERRRGLPGTYERRFRRKDGETVWTTASATPVIDGQDRFGGSFAMFTDITERKRAEEEVARVNRALRMLSDSNQALIRITGEAELLSEVCRIAVDVGGYRMAWVGFAEHDDARTIRPVARAGFDSGYVETSAVGWADDERGRGPGGIAIRTGRPCVAHRVPDDPAFAPWREAAIRRGYVSLAALPLVSGGETLGALGIYSGEAGSFDEKEVAILSELAGDLAFGIAAARTRVKREQAESALARQHSTLRGILEGTTSAIFSLDRQYRFVAFNRSHVEAMKRLEGAEIEIGRCMLDCIRAPGDRKQAREDFDRALAGEHFVKLVAAGGEPGTRQFLEVSHHPVRDAGGSVAGVAVFAADVSGRERAQRRVRREAERGSLLVDAFMRSPQLSEKQIYEEALDLAVRLTDSAIGFLHRVSDDQKTVLLTAWNREALESCSAPYDTHYPMDAAGNWVDCVRLGVPVVYNDFPASPNQKGLPPGHTPVRRFASVPVVEGGRVGIVFGVGNKAWDYEDDDVFQIQQVAAELLKILRQRRAAEQLRESEERYRLIAENTADTITVLDFDLRRTFVSPSVMGLRGYSVDEAMAQTLDQVFTAGSLREVRKLFAEQMALEAAGTADPSRSATLEVEEYRKDGSTIWVEIVVSFVRDASLRATAILAVARDITRRKMADLRLVESEQEYRSLADSSPDNIVRYDTERRLVYVNRNVGSTVGFDLGSLIGRTHTDGTGFPSIDAYREKLREVIRSGQPEELEVVVANPAGEMRTHNIRFVAERNRDGAVIGALAFGRDVTDLKEAAREKQKYLDQLRQNLEDTVTAIAATVEARDPYTAGHQRRVAALAATIAGEMGLGEEAQQGLHIAGTVHDLGKIKIPAEILARPGHLAEIEARLIQLHAEAGWEILKGIEFPWPIAEMVLEHHERLDGSGYPNRLKGEQISQGARILAVADVVEAMASHRPYRPSRGMEAALAEIERDRGVLYDAAVVDACLRLFRERGYRLQD